MRSRRVVLAVGAAVAAAALALPAAAQGRLAADLPASAVAVSIPVPHHAARTVPAAGGGSRRARHTAPRPRPRDPGGVPRAARPGTPVAVPAARRTAPARRTQPAPPAAGGTADLYPPHFPVAVALGPLTTQVVTVAASGTWAAVTAWQRTGSGPWVAVASTTDARIGYGGLVPGASRVQNTGTTPEGTYTMTQAFGNDANPGTFLPWTQVVPTDWWDEDPASVDYNQLVNVATTRPDFPLTPAQGEQLSTYPVQYAYAVVIDFNRWPAVPGRGAGIFLHVNGAGPTAGCVSVPAPMMVFVLRWLRPAQHPLIAIGP